MTTLLDVLARRRRDVPAATASSASDMEAALAPVAGPEIEFAGYAEDCRVFGFLRLTGDRMTDMLNDRPAYALSDAMVVRLDTGAATQVTDLVVERDEILAVRASGPRGDPERRSRRRPFPMTLQTGPYIVHGYVHGIPGGDPIREIRRRPPMVPFTEAWIEYVSGGQHHRARVGTIIVNRESWDWIRQSRDEEVRLPDLPAETKPDPLAKDMTGYIRDRGE
jgi:hypothetical protein